MNRVILAIKIVLSAVIALGIVWWFERGISSHPRYTQTGSDMMAIRLLLDMKSLNARCSSAVDPELDKSLARISDPWGHPYRYAEVTNAASAIPDFRIEERLTPEHVDFFETYGFIRFKRFATRDAAAALYAAFNALTADLVARDTSVINGVPLIKGRRDDGTAFYGRIPFVSLQREEFRTFLGDPRFQAIIDDLAPGSRIGHDERDGLDRRRVPQTGALNFGRQAGMPVQRRSWRCLAYRPMNMRLPGLSMPRSPIYEARRAP